MRKLLVRMMYACALLAAACNRQGDYTTDPNTATSAPLKLLLPATELSVATLHATELAWYASVFMQHQAGVARQWEGADHYLVSNADLNRPWNSAYATALINLKKIRAQSDSLGAAAYGGIANILTAMALGQITDAWGDAPYREALQESLNLQPAYDAQEVLYDSIQQLLADALALLDQPSAVLPADDDLIYQGDLARWKQTAHILQARYANHLSRRDPAGSATKALAAIDAGIYVSTADDAAQPYGQNQTDANPWFQFVNQRGDVRMGAYLVSLMQSTGDPRLPFYAEQDAQGNYSGSPAGSPDVKASIMGLQYAAIDAPVPLVTLAEARFIEAEAALRLGDAARAAQAYNAGVRASLQKSGIATHPYLEAYAQETTVTISLQKIMNQKYLALFTQAEVWTDWRRTGYPELQPANGNTTGGVIPRRLPYPLDELNYNGTNVPSGTGLTSRVWWDQ